MLRMPNLLLATVILSLLAGCEKDKEPERDSISLSGTLEHSLTIASNTDVQVQETLIVPENMELTVQSGVHFLVNEGLVIRVEGCLIANGNSDNPIEFKRAADAEEWYGIVSTLADSSLSAMDLNHVIVEDCVQGLGIMGSNTQLQNGIIRNCYIGVTCSGDIGTILNSVEVRDCEIGLSISSNSDVQVSNLWSHDNSYGVWAYNNKATLTQSIIEDNHPTGIRCDLDHDSLLIIENTITNCENGLIYYSASHVVLHRNTISNNTRGILLVSYSRATISVSQNNITDNSQYAMGYTDPVWPADNAIDVSNNWWGTTDSLEISQAIIDVYDNSDFDTLRFVPFALEPF